MAQWEEYLLSSRNWDSNPQYSCENVGVTSHMLAYNLNSISGKNRKVF